MTVQRRRQHASKIKASMGKSVAGFVEAGKALINAKSDLEHGEFEVMLEEDLSMNLRTAERLMAIARHPVLSNATHESHLPPSWQTLYEITRLPDRVIKSSLSSGRINSFTQRKEVSLMLDEALGRRERLGRTRSRPVLSPDACADHLIMSVTNVIDPEMHSLFVTVAENVDEISVEKRRKIERAVADLHDRMQQLLRPILPTRPREITHA